MLLTIDIGNTQTALGLFSGDELAASWALTTHSGDTADELQLALSGLLGLGGYSCGEVYDVAIASVVPGLTTNWAAVAHALTGRDALVVGPGVKSGLPLRYDNPVEIGADRVADAVAAVALEGAPVVVVDLGTATNIEVVDKNGAFLGGIIAPGMATGAAALAEHAARLPQTDISFPKHVIGTNTNDAIRSGITYGEVARIDGLVGAVFGELGYTAPVIATGGHSGRIAGLSKTITRREPHLTLLGLKLIHEMNR